MTDTIWIVEQCDYEGCMLLGVFDNYEDADEYFGELLEYAQQSDDEMYEYEKKSAKELGREILPRGEYIGERYAVRADGSKEYKGFLDTYHLYGVEAGWRKWHPPKKKEDRQ